MNLLILRCFFILASSGAGVYIAGNTPAGLSGFFGVLALIVVVIGLDALIPSKKVDWVSSVYFGLLVGLALTYALSLAFFPLIELQDDPEQMVIRRAIMLVIGLPVCYLCVSMLFQTRNDFRFIIPYVEFQKNLRGNRPLILDTSVVIDGRIADVVETMIIDSRLIMPRFAIVELQRIADSSDRGRRTRGRRGLDILNRLQKMKGVDLQIDDTDLAEFKGQPVDLKLVALARHIEGKLVTNDYNLNKVAKLQGVEVINLNDLATALKPVFLPGEKLDVEIVKSGEEINQGIGYLDDGTMVVVDNGRAHLAERAIVTVTSVLQTSAGRMIFGRYEYTTKKLSTGNSGTIPVSEEKERTAEYSVDRDANTEKDDDMTQKYSHNGGNQGSKSYNYAKRK
ncbi:MAG: PIN domain-containing protein [Planctomycetaceae bacterium]|nr:PIN domain-containing protein [Planctomycetaceae bacterium]